MTTKIRDEDFLTPSIINQMPCATSDRWLEAIEEQVIVTQCCQDSNDIGLVIIDFTLVGAFLFTPYCKIKRVDLDTTYETNNISAPLALGHYKNPNMPINTNCLTFHGQVVFDFASVIPNYISCSEIEFELGMIGQVPQAYGVSYPNQTPIYRYIWQKGLLPSPVSINYTNGNFNIVFEYNGNINCSCAIQCIIPSGISQTIQFCPNQTQSITVYNGELTTDPVNLLIQLRDSLGNTTLLGVQPLISVVPSKPSASLLAYPRRIEVGINRTSINNTILEEVEYQIFKYRGTPNNSFVWKDWSFRSETSFIDMDIIPNQTYGYAVRYRGKFSDISNISSWTIVNT